MVQSTHSLVIAINEIPPKSQVNDEYLQSVRGFNFKLEMLKKQSKEQIKQIENRRYAASPRSKNVKFLQTTSTSQKSNATTGRSAEETTAQLPVSAGGPCEATA